VLKKEKLILNMYDDRRENPLYFFDISFKKNILDY